MKCTERCITYAGRGRKTCFSARNQDMQSRGRDGLWDDLINSCCDEERWTGRALTYVPSFPAMVHCDWPQQRCHRVDWFQFSLSVLLSWINSSALIHIRDIWKTVFRDASRHSNTCARALFPVADSCSSASVPSTFYLASVLGLISLIWLSSEYLEEWDSSVSEKLWSRKQAELLWWPFYWQPKSNNPQIIANLERSGEVKKSLSLRVVALWFSPPTIWIGSVMCLIWSKIFSSALKLENFMDAWCVTDLISFHPSPWTGTDATTSQRLSPSIWHLGVRAVAGSKC